MCSLKKFKESRGTATVEYALGAVMLISTLVVSACIFLQRASADRGVEASRMLEEIVPCQHNSNGLDGDECL